MTPWTPPASVHLSSNDITNVVNGLLDRNARAAALAFVDTLKDDAYVYTVACEVAYRSYRPRPEVSDGDTYRAFIRDLTAVAR